MEQNNQGNNQQNNQGYNQQYSREGYPLKPFEYGHFNLALHVVLLLFTCGIWWFIWVYRTTDYLNRLESEPRQTPIYQLLLCLIPFYSIYWTYKNATKIDKYAAQNHVYSDITAVSVVLAIFVSIATAVIMQLKINEIIQPTNTNGYKYQNGTAGSYSSQNANTGEYSYQSTNAEEQTGANAGEPSRPYAEEETRSYGEEQPRPFNAENIPDVSNTALNVLSFFFPIVGLILYIVWKDQYPIKAKAIGKWALVGFCVWVACSIISAVITACSAVVLSAATLL